MARVRVPLACAAHVLCSLEQCAPEWDEAKQVLLLRAGTHCHAPSCLNETLVVKGTGEVLCVNVPLVGQGVQHKFDELSYAVGVPPCVWGEAEGLRRPPLLSLDTELEMVKFCNASHYHYGVMAQWQMRGAWA